MYSVYEAIYIIYIYILVETRNKTNSGANFPHLSYILLASAMHENEVDIHVFEFQNRQTHTLQ